MGSTSNGAYALDDVSKSLADLENLTAEIASAEPALEADGVDLVDWGPDPADNEVDATVIGSVTAAQAVTAASERKSTWCARNADARGYKR